MVGKSLDICGESNVVGSKYKPRGWGRVGGWVGGSGVARWGVGRGVGRRGRDNFPPPPPKQKVTHVTSMNQKAVSSCLLDR